MILNLFSICQTQKIINKYWDDNAVRDLLQILVFLWAISIKTWHNTTPKNYNLNLVMTEAWISRSLFVAWAMGMRLGRLQYDYGFKCAKGLWPFVQYVQHVKISQYKFQSANFTVQFHSANFTVQFHSSNFTVCSTELISTVWERVCANFTMCSAQFKNSASLCKFHSVFSRVPEECKHVQISQCQLRTSCPSHYSAHSGVWWVLSTPSFAFQHFSLISQFSVEF